MADAGSILFPSITICKDEMFNNVKYSDRGLITRLQSGEVSTENARSWFRNRTFSRARLVRFLSIKTVEGSNNFPCNTASGPRAGEPCSFPYVYPDCKLMMKGVLGRLVRSTLIDRRLSRLCTDWLVLLRHKGGFMH